MTKQEIKDRVTQYINENDICEKALGCIVNDKLTGYYLEPDFYCWNEVRDPYAELPVLHFSKVFYLSESDFSYMKERVVPMTAKAYANHNDWFFEHDIHWDVIALIYYFFVDQILKDCNGRYEMMSQGIFDALLAEDAIKGIGSEACCMWDECLIEERYE